ncbi:hypothetical protein W97_00429 [Coniosporium apollinis CBS 100218]|uniref:Uncharacterized protein n=1 Tax=Coniosporium apollinis (strain CBS 100218) TaxID=1168221 RepID=R7YHV3_CONA1|nr:uncharacterized protein W97_00429 [Coniosporium apollinis CBS 100218]EON61216.1 hypothetical protein W97_00429 [Coniosporium apollinis CBS 100218]
MGGKAFPKLHVPRMPPAEYLKVRDKSIKTVRKFFRHVVCPPGSPEKIDHGDVDLLVCDPTSSYAPERLEKALGAVANTGNSQITSFAIPVDKSSKDAFAQVDIHVCETEYLDWELWMGAYGDLSQIIAFIIQPARQFLGLDEKRYQAGFRTLQEMFVWSSECKCLQEPMRDRGIDRGRPVFKAFLNWAASNLKAPKEPILRNQIPRLAIFVFGVQKQYDTLVARDRKLSTIESAVLKSYGGRLNTMISELARWAPLEKGGYALLRPSNEAHMHMDINANDWLDEMNEDRLEQLIVWIRDNMAEIKRREKFWDSEQKLVNALQELPTPKRQVFQEFEFTSERFTKELLICRILALFNRDEELLRQHSTEKIGAD